MRTEIQPSDANYATLGLLLAEAGEPLCCGMDRWRPEAIGLPIISVYSDADELLGVCLVMWPTRSGAFTAFALTAAGKGNSGSVIASILNTALRLSPGGVVMNVRAARVDENNYCARVGAVLVGDGAPPGYNSYRLIREAFIYYKEAPAIDVDWGLIKTRICLGSAGHA